MATALAARPCDMSAHTAGLAGFSWEAAGGEERKRRRALCTGELKQNNAHSSFDTGNATFVLAAAHSP